MTTIVEQDTMSPAILVTGASRRIGEAVYTAQTIVADGGYYLVDPVMKWEAADNEA